MSWSDKSRQASAAKRRAKKMERIQAAANWLIASGRKNGWSKVARQFKPITPRDIRRFLATSPYNLSCEPAGPRKPWVYWITAVREEDARRRRMALINLLTRFDTELSMNDSFILSTHGNTREGKVVRAQQAHLKAAIAELELVD